MPTPNALAETLRRAAEAVEFVDLTLRDIATAAAGLNADDRAAAATCAAENARDAAALRALADRLDAVTADELREEARACEWVAERNTTLNADLQRRLAALLTTLAGPAGADTTTREGG